MKNETEKKHNVTMIINKVQYEKLELEAKKRHLPPGEYLEMLIEMDQISNGREYGPDGGMAVAISEKHYSLLRQEAEEVGFDTEETAEMIIGLSAETLPERPLSREGFDAVVEAWGGVDFPSERKRSEEQRRGNSLEQSSS